MTNISVRGLGLVSENRRKLKSGNEYNALIPKPNGKMVIIKEDADVQDTIQEIKKLVRECAYQTEKLAKVLKGNTLLDTCRNIFDFCYQHIQYRLDDEGTEQVHEPARIWAERERGVDCDDYTIFVSCLLTNLGIPHKLRLAEYAHKGYYQHIYVVVPISHGKYLTIDPVKDKFNDEHNTKEMPLTGKEDIEMKLQRLSGLGNFDDDMDLGTSYYDLNGKEITEAEWLKLKSTGAYEQAADLKTEAQRHQLLMNTNENYRQDYATTQNYATPKFMSKDWWQKNGLTVGVVAGAGILGLAFLVSFIKNDDEDDEKERKKEVSGIKNTKKPKLKNNLK